MKDLNKDKRKSIEKINELNDNYKKQKQELEQILDKKKN